MATNVKFSSKLDQALLEELKGYAEESNKNISSVLNEAVSDYLARARLRPAFMKAATEVVEENEVLLEKLAR